MSLSIISVPRDIGNETWNYAIRNGFVTKHLGDMVLCLGQADYIKVGDRIRSINGDTPPNNVRWVVYPYDGGTRYRGKRWNISTDIDRIAIEYFFGEVTNSSGDVI